MIRYLMIAVVGVGWVFGSRAGLPASLSGLTGWPYYLVGRREEDREGGHLGRERLELVSDYIEYKYIVAYLAAGLAERLDTSLPPVR
jgi:hypothetical protein